MRDDWSIKKISEVANVIGGGTPSSKVSEYYGGNISWITPKDLSNYNFRRISNGNRSITKLGLEKSSARLLPKDSVLLTSRAPIGYVAIAACELSTNQGFKSLDLKEGNDHDFFYYLLKNNISLLQSMATGSTFKEISGQVLKNIKFFIPSYREQIKIGSFLKTLDDKIELNIQTNQTLEALAQAIFKSWFVDFDPVKAKEKLKEGIDLDSIAKELGMSKEILALFPDEFEESESGLLPKGWELKPLYETAEYINGSAFKAKDFSDNNEGLPIIKIAELKQGISAGTKFTLNEVKSKYFIDNGDVLYSWSGSPETSLEVFKWHGGKGWLNQHIFKLNFDSLQQRNFTYFLLKQIKPLLISTAKQKQTTGLGHITVADMKRIKIIYPDKDVLKKFSEKINPLYERSSKLIEEIGTLTKLRDTLLPKLLSDEITFKDQT